MTGTGVDALGSTVFLQFAAPSGRPELLNLHPPDTVVFPPKIIKFTAAGFMLPDHSARDGVDRCATAKVVSVVEATPGCAKSIARLRSS